MKSNLIININDFNYIKKGNYIEFEYKNTDNINSFISYLITQKEEIRYFKRNNNLIIKTKFNNDSFEYQNIINEVTSFLNFAIHCNKINGKIDYSEEGYRFLINKSIYNHIYNNYLLKKDNKYIFNINYYNELIKEINKYNKQIKLISSLDNINDINESTIDNIKKYYNTNQKLFIYKNNGIELYIIGDNYYRFHFNDNNNFYNIILPEIIKLYINNINNINKKEVIKQFNIDFVNINDNFYLIGFKDNIIYSTITYLDNIMNRRKYYLDINSNFTYSNELDNNKQEKRIYSYGYINILFISFLISIITIIFCIFKM